MEDLHRLLDAIRISRDAKSKANSGYEPGEAALLGRITTGLEAAAKAVNGEQRGSCYTAVASLAKCYITQYIPTHTPEPHWALATA